MGLLSLLDDPVRIRKFVQMDMRINDRDIHC